AADHRSFYRAARALGVEQSTLSRSVLRLERAVGAKLFHRTTAGVSTTVVGARFIRNARTLVASADHMIAITRAAGEGRAGSLVFGFNCAISASNLRSTMLCWAGKNPEVNLEGVEADRRELLGGLDSGEIDIAILMGDAGQDGFRREVFWSERILVALPAGHPLANNEIVHWTDLRGQRFALTAADPGPDIRDMLLGRLSMAGVPTDIRMSRTSRETILSLLGLGGRVSVVCEGSIGTRYDEVVFRPLYGEQGPSYIAFSGYWRSDNDNPALKRFLAFVRRRYSLSFNLTESGKSGSST
ncbi:MAG: LysR family transcriptional regulator, partial [Erythrobacter sp.]